MTPYPAKTISITNTPYRAIGALWLAVSACLIGTSPVHAQEIDPSVDMGSIGPIGKPQTTAIAKKRVVSTPASNKTVSKPDWDELTPSQQQALSPLAPSWAGIDEPRKRKWLAISQNFGSLPAEEQTRMHSRMKEWAALSPQERVQARLNFAGARELPLDKRIEKWEEYKALPREQRKQLAATAPGKPTGAATAVKPLPLKNLTAALPAPTPSAPKRLADGLSIPHNSRIPRIATSSHLIDNRTLLPLSVSAKSGATNQP
ncbi:MAG: DUF3106 domain-containing protein [Hylemonella sp.]|nr:DUF3106 domain-containing protein [Hylemonella sp.]